MANKTRGKAQPPNIKEKMLLSVVSRPRISTFGSKKNKKKLYVSLPQQMASPHPSDSTTSSSRGSNGKDQLSKTNIYTQGLQPGTTDRDPIKSSYGRIVSPEVILEKSTSKCSSATKWLCAH